MKAYSLMATTAVLFTAPAVSAQEPQTTADGWTVSRIGYGCAASQTLANKQPTTLTVLRTVRDENQRVVELQLRMPYKRADSSYIKFTVHISGETAEIGTGNAYLPLDQSKNKPRFRATLNSAGMALFESGSLSEKTILFRLDGKDVASTPIGQLSTVDSTLEDCFATVRQELLDRRPPGEAEDSPRRDPIPRNSMMRWVTMNDYRSSWINKGWEGQVALTLTVSRYGFVDACTITASSGYPAMDQTTCRLMTRRARFYAGRNDNQEAIESAFSTGVRWLIPG